MTLKVYVLICFSHLQPPIFEEFDINELLRLLFNNCQERKLTFNYVFIASITFLMVPIEYFCTVHFELS